MADKKISQLSAATTPLAGTEVLPIVQSSTTDQVSVANLTAGRAVSAASLTLTSSPLPIASGGTNQTAFTAPSGNVKGLIYFDGTSFANDATVTKVGYDTSTNTVRANNLTASGKFAAGGNPVTGYQQRFTGSFSETISTESVGVVVDNTIAPPAGGYNATNAYIAGTITKPAGSGVTNATGLLLGAPTINGSGTATTGTTLRIINAPTGATTNRALWVQAGASEFAGDVTLTSSNLVIGTSGKGIVMKNAAGTVTKLVRLNDTGDGFVFENV